MKNLKLAIIGGGRSYATAKMYLKLLKKEAEAMKRRYMASKETFKLLKEGVKTMMTKKDAVLTEDTYMMECVDNGLVMEMVRELGYDSIPPEDDDYTILCKREKFNNHWKRSKKALSRSSQPLIRRKILKCNKIQNPQI